MNSLAGFLRGFVLAVLALAFLARGAHAAEPLVDQGDTTYDPNTGLVWLDLHFTQGQSYASILGGWGDFTTSLGYRFATAEEIRQLFLNAGAKSLGSPNEPPVSVNFEAAKLALSLLGTTMPMADTNRSWMFYDPASDNPPASSYVPTAVFGEGMIGGGYPAREGFFLIPGLYPTTTSSSPEWASALVKVAPEPVPSILLYANDFAAGPASLDGLEKVLHPTRGEVSVTVEAGQLKVSIADIGYAGVSRDLRIGNPLFKPRLPANRGLLTWSFNISNEDGAFNNNFDFVLASSHADPFEISAHGYALRGGGMVGNRMLLWRFSHGLSGGGEFIDITDGLGPLPQKGSFRVTFDPETKLWSLYGEIGATYADPRSVKTLLGSATDNTHIEEALPFIALLGQTTGADYFDNVRVSMVAGPNRLPIARRDLVYLTAEVPMMIYPLANDEDPEGGPLRIASVTASQTGTVEIIPGIGGLRDALRYTPAPGTNATGETLTYTVAEEDGETASGEIAIVPVRANAAWPAIELFLQRGEVAEFSFIEDMAGNNPWRIAGIGAPERGTLDNGPSDDFASLGKLRYTPPEGVIQKDRFSITVVVNNLIITREVRVQRPPKGRFEGLYKHDGPEQEVEGRLRVNLSAGRQFTAVVQLRGKTKRIRGRLDSTGFSELKNGGTLQMWRDEGQLAVRGFLPEEAGETGNDSEPDGWITSANRVTFGEAGDLEGRYTLLLPAASVPGADSESAVPVRGHGWGVLRVLANGWVTLAGATGDGKRWNSAGILRDDRTLLLYGAIKRGKHEFPGSLAGMLSFRQDGSNSDGDGILHWLPPSSPEDRLSKTARRQPILLSRYIEPVPGALPLAAGVGSDNAQFSFSTAPVVLVRIINGVFIQVGEIEGTIQMASVTLSSAGFDGTANSTDGFSVRAEIRPQSGVFKGFFQAPESQEWKFFKGVIFQRTQSGHGAFMGSVRSGAVSLRLPAP